MNAIPTYPYRQIRSFVRREGRITPRGAKALNDLWPKYGLILEPGDLVDLNAVFGRTADIILEIGFGDGQSLIEMAKREPECDFIGIDVYRTGIGSLLAAIDEQGLGNLRVFCKDAMEVLAENIPDNFLRRIQVFFPDPWPKKRHQKRRLVQAPFIKLAAKKLIIGGLLHLVTDWMDYAYQMMSELSASPCFMNTAGEGQFMPRPVFRPLTKYEQRGHRLGHQTWDLIFKRVEA